MGELNEVVRRLKWSTPLVGDEFRSVCSGHRVRCEKQFSGKRFTVKVCCKRLGTPANEFTDKATRIMRRVVRRVVRDE